MTVTAAVRPKRPQMTPISLGCRMRRRTPTPRSWARGLGVAKSWSGGERKERCHCWEDGGQVSTAGRHLGPGSQTNHTPLLPRLQPAKHTWDGDWSARGVGAEAPTIRGPPGWVYRESGQAGGRVSFFGWCQRCRSEVLWMHTLAQPSFLPLLAVCVCARADSKAFTSRAVTPGAPLGRCRYHCTVGILLNTLVKSVSQFMDTCVG